MDSRNLAVFLLALASIHSHPHQKPDDEWMSKSASSDYPEETIAGLIQKSKHLHKYFDNAMTPTLALVTSRFAKSEDQMELCTYKTKTLMPRKMRDVDGKLRFVVNIAPKHLQIITVEVCTHAGGACVEESSLPINYQTQCQQKYSIMKLLALSEDGEGLEFTKFFVPSGCVCLYKMTNLFL